MSGVGVRTAAELLTEVAHKAFASAGHLAAYVGLAKVTRAQAHPFVASIRPGAGTRVLKRALFLSAFAALRDPSHWLATHARSSRASNITRRSSHWHGDAATSCSPCCETAPFTNPSQILTLDEPIGASPRSAAHSGDRRRRAQDAARCRAAPDGSRITKHHHPLYGRGTVPQHRGSRPACRLRVLSLRLRVRGSLICLSRHAEVFGSSSLNGMRAV